MANLTDKQENFALEYVLNGGNASAAYRKHYDVGEKTLETTVWRDAHKTLHKPNVNARIVEYRAQKYSTKVMTIEERKAKLTEMAHDDNIKALDMLNKMDGVYIEKTEQKITQEVHYYAPEKKADK